MTHVRQFCRFCVLVIAWAGLACHAHEISSPHIETTWEPYPRVAEPVFEVSESKLSDPFQALRSRVLQKWSDGALPERKTFVQYLDNDFTRVKIDYEQGAVVVEALVNAGAGAAGESMARNQIKNALSEVVSKDTSSLRALLTRDEIMDGSRTVQQFATSLTERLSPAVPEKGEDEQERNLYRVTFKMVPNHVKRRAAKFKPIVDLWARKYALDPALILGIMRQESAFNPRARSKIGALGLMQIYPKYAGREVLKVLKGKTELPADDYFYDPKENIMVGATFLRILRDRYFAEIKDSEKQRYLIICAYNWSAGRLRKAIATGRLPIRAPAGDVFDRLERITPSETRHYLKKVIRYANQFKGNWHAYR